MIFFLILLVKEALLLIICSLVRFLCDVQKLSINRVFRSFYKSDRSDISANVVDICLSVNIMLL